MRHKNENLTAAEAGNSPAVIFNHYRALVPEGDVDAYWSLVPAEHLAENIVALAEGGIISARQL